MTKGIFHINRLHYLSNYLFLLLVLLLILPFNTHASGNATHTTTDFNNGTFSGGVEYDNTTDKVKLKHGNGAEQENFDDLKTPFGRTTQIKDNKIKIGKTVTAPLIMSPSYSSTATSGIVFDGDIEYVYYSVVGQFGISQIDTKGTDDPLDDELLHRYGMSSTGAKLPSNTIYYMFKEEDIFYICSEAGLTLLDTHGTTSALDDTIIKTYFNASDPPDRYNNPVSYAYKEGNYIYVTPGRSGGGYLQIMYIGDPRNLSDDSLVKRYDGGSSPAISSNPYKFIKEGSLLYIATVLDGVFILDIGDPANTTDDVKIKQYKTTSTPSIIYDRTTDITKSGNKLFISTMMGLSILDIGDPTDARNHLPYTDDFPYRTYTTATTPALSNDYINSVNLDASTLYVSSSGGLDVIDLESNTLITRYNQTSDPPVDSTDESVDNGSSAVCGSNIRNGLIYANVCDNGISVINSSGYFSKGQIERDALPITNTAMSWTEQKSSGQNILLKTRTGSTGTVTTNDFNNTVLSPSVPPAYAGDPYNNGWGSFDAEEKNGNLELTNPSSGGNVTFWLDAQPSGSTFPLGSTIYVRLKVNSNTVVQNTGWDQIFTQDYRSGNGITDDGIFDLSNNKWKTVRLVAPQDFRYIGIDFYWGGSWSPEDTVQIDYLKVMEPVSSQHINFGDNINSSSYGANPYPWGDSLSDRKEIGGNLVLSNRTPGTNVNADFTISTGKSAYYYKKGSTVRAKIKINSSTVTGLNGYMFTDDWGANDGGSFESPGNNEFFDATMTIYRDAFSLLGFEFSCDTGTWAPTDSIEVDYVDIYEPVVWGNWSTPSSDHSSYTIPDTSGKSVFQYQFDLETSDPTSSPEIDSISFGLDGYSTSGTYTSPVVTGSDTVNDWTTLEVNADTPAGTTITSETRSGDTAVPDGSWSDWTAADTTIDSPNSQYVQYRINIETSDPVVTPAISSVVVNWDSVSGTPPGDGGTTPPGDGTIPPITTGTIGTIFPSDNNDNPKTNTIVAAVDTPTQDQKTNGAETGTSILKQDGLSSNIESKENTDTTNPKAPIALLWMSLSVFALGFSKRFYFSVSDYWQFFGALVAVREKKKRWGTVFDSITEKPIFGATVSIFETQFNQLVETKITDKKGRFVINANPGQYYILVTSESYQFPSKHSSFGYTGAKFTIEENEPLVLLDIPLDPIGKKAFSRFNIFDSILYVLNKICYPVLVLGTIFAIYTVTQMQSTMSYLTIALYILLWIYEFITAFYAKAYGTVYDPKTKKLLDNATVRVFDANTEKLIETNVTNTKGRYSLLLAPGHYLVSVSCEGFQTLFKKASFMEDGYLHDTFYMRVE